MDVLEAVIQEKIAKAEKRKAVEEAAPGVKKFMRRGDLKQLEKQEMETRKEERLAKRLRDKGDEEGANEILRLRKEKEREAQQESDDSILLQSMPPIEVKRRLRSRGEPITLFGESDLERIRRLKQIELKHHEREGGSSAGAKNDLRDIIAMDVEAEIRRATLAAYDKKQTEQDDGADPDAAAQDDSKEKDEKRDSKYEHDRGLEEFVFVEEYVAFFFKRIMYLWEKELEARPDEVKRSTRGKVAAATQKQTRQYLKPLLKQLKNRKVDPGILDNCVGIVNNCRQLEYVRANDCYLRMAIGNAAWPMGVTMVGIHERAGREKIHNANVAHVLNDDTSRKFIQAIKRLITHAQHQFPTAPNKMVN